MLIGKLKSRMLTIVLVLLFPALVYFMKDFFISKKQTILSSDLISEYQDSPWSVVLDLDFTIPLLLPVNVSLEKTARPLVCNGCMSVQYNYLTNNERICAGNRHSVQILILIVSAPRNKVERDVLRSTWLTYTNNNKGSIRYVFLIGHSTKDESVKVENSYTKDIIIGNFHDSYSTSTLKTLMGFKWMEQFCNNTKFVVKTDDDVYINIPGLKRIIDKNAEDLQTSILGRCFFDLTPIRDKESKWFVSHKSYPQSSYPGCCVGNGLVASRKVISDIVHVFKNVPYLYLDDVYISLCLQALGYRVKNSHGFDIMPSGTNLCSYKDVNVVAIHKCEVKCLKTIWNYPCKPH